jgi:hypothetical protein
MQRAAAQAELEALRKLKQELQKEEEKKKSRPKYDSETPSVATKKIWDMTPEEFIEYEKKLKQQAMR